MVRHSIGTLEIFTYEVFSSYGGVSCFATTRAGGVSSMPFSSLNLGLRCGDDPDDVIDNRAQLGLLTGAFPDLLTFGGQVHGSRVAVVTGDLIGSGAFDPDDSIPETDAMVTDIPDVGLLVLVADCVAVSLYDPVKKAIGIAHAGWRGTAAGIAGSTVAKMREAFGTAPSDLIAAIGPSIGPCCYEVGSEVVDRFAERCPDMLESILVTRRSKAGSGGGGDGTYLDLWEANLRQLTAGGIRRDNVEIAGVCTSCRTDLFYSHRAEKGRTGRFAGFIMLHGNTRRAYEISAL
jgi:YfiH family protein